MLESFLSDPTAWLHAFVDRAHESLTLIALMWIVQIIASTTQHRFSRALAIVSWHPLKIWAIVTAPIAHGGFWHLIANTVPFVAFGTIIAYSPRPIPASLAVIPGIEYASTFAIVSIAAGLTSGLGAFVCNRPGVHTLGASGLIFGYFGYLVTAGLREGIGPAFGVAILLAGVWGASMLRGILPRFGSNVSWQGHLFGLIGGIAAAYVLVPTT